MKTDYDVANAVLDGWYKQIQTSDEGRSFKTKAYLWIREIRASLHTLLIK